MAGGRFTWVKPDVYPLIAAVSVGCMFAVYSMARNLYTNPDVHVSKAVRQEGVPESGSLEARAEGYKQSVYRSLKGRGPSVF